VARVVRSETRVGAPPRCKRASLETPTKIQLPRDGTAGPSALSTCVSPRPPSGREIFCLPGEPNPQLKLLNNTRPAQRVAQAGRMTPCHFAYREKAQWISARRAPSSSSQLFGRLPFCISPCIRFSTDERSVRLRSKSPALRAAQPKLFRSAFNPSIWRRFPTDPCWIGRTTRLTENRSTYAWRATTLFSGVRRRRMAAQHGQGTNRSS
jgi:hypothetical protein